MAEQKLAEKSQKRSAGQSGCSGLQSKLIANAGAVPIEHMMTIVDKIDFTFSSFVENFFRLII